MNSSSMSSLSGKTAWNWQTSSDADKPRNYIRYKRPKINSPFFQSKSSFSYSGNIRVEKSETQQTQTLKIAKYFTDKAAIKPKAKYDPVLYYMGQ
jgi:hypothetical protein